MSAPQFTPGPWRAAFDGYPLSGERELEICCIPHSTYDALEVFAPTADGREDWPARHSEPGHDEHLANARLIAAAPELYESCEAALQWFEDNGCAGGIAAHIRGSLRKARGADQ